MTAARLPVVGVVGPTATGKSALALAIARALNGEIVNADSRQVYRHMDIGTAKPTAAERSSVPHHLYDIIDPDESFTLADYLSRARGTIADIAGRHRLPILCGGSGLYVRAVLDGLAPPAVPPNAALRAELERTIADGGLDRLMDELRAADPVAATRIDPRNSRRVIRALEVIRLTGKPFSAQGTVTPPPYTTIRIGLTMERAALYARIDRRVDAMIAAGWLEETAALIAAGYAPDLPALTSLGYRDLIAVLRGEQSLPTAIDRIKRQTHRFVHQQYTWFKLADPAILWHPADAPDLADRVIALLHDRRA